MTSAHRVAAAFALVAVVVLLSSSPARAAADSSTELTAEDISKAIAEGEAHMKADRIAPAITAFTAVIRAKPDHAQARLLRATCRLRRGERMHALEDLNEVLNYAPSLRQARLRRAKVLLEIGDYAAAERDYNKLLADDKKQDAAATTAREQLPVVRRAATAMEAASQAIGSGHCTDHVRSQLQSALELSPAAAPLLKALAQCHLAQAQFAEVLDVAGRWSKADSKSVDAMMLRGQAFFYMGDTKMALDHFAQGLQLDPDHAECRRAFRNARDMDKLSKVADADLAAGRPRDAIDALHRAAEIDPSAGRQNGELQMRACTIAATNVNDPPLAELECTAALALSPGSADAHAHRAEARMAQRNFDGAAQDFQRLVEQQPHNGHWRQKLQSAHRAAKIAKRKDYYAILGVARTATKTQIKAAFRELARVWHPDKRPMDQRAEAEAKYRDMSEAHQVLCDDVKRQRFDNGEDVDDEPQQQQQHHHHQWQHQWGGFRHG